LADAPPGAADAIPAKVRRYAEGVLRRYDKNGDGRLQPEEWGKMHGNPQAADANGDRAVTLEELTRHVAAFGRNRRLGLANPMNTRDGAGGADLSTAGREGTAPDGPPPNGPEGGSKSASPDASPRPTAGDSARRSTTFYVPTSQLPPGLPDWFLRRDLDGDGQLSLAEFAPNPTQADLEEFVHYDRNGDGLITAKECVDVLKPARSPGRKAAAPDKSGGKSGRKKTAAP
jgi:hypothetical protein